MTKSVVYLFISFTTFLMCSCLGCSKNKKSVGTIATPPVTLKINDCYSDSGSYLQNSEVKLSCKLLNKLTSPISIKAVNAKIRNLSTSSDFFEEVVLKEDFSLDAGDSLTISNRPIWQIPVSAAKEAYGIYIEVTFPDNSQSIMYQTFFRVTEPSMLTHYNISKSTYQGLNIFCLDGGMSAEYSVEKAAETLGDGISHSWFVNAPGSGPNHVYATPQFLEKSVEHTVDFYNNHFGANTTFSTVIISTGIPSVAYLAATMKAPVLPLHFLVSCNTGKEIQTILNYSNQHRLSSYAALGHDPSVPFAVAWIKLLDIPDQYIDFLKQHHVQNIILCGATGSTGGEATAKEVISSENTGKYDPASLYILYPQGGTAEDLIQLRSKIKDFGELDISPAFMRIADWESGINAEQTTNFSRTIKARTNINKISLITAAEDISLWNLGTYLLLSFIDKNKALLTQPGKSPINGVTLNPYLVAHPRYECKMLDVPMLYWQLNPPQHTVDRLKVTVKNAISTYFPTVDFDHLNFTINASNNFAGANVQGLKSSLIANGFMNITESDHSEDEIWNPADELKAPCERAASSIVASGVSSYTTWNSELLLLNMDDLRTLATRFPEILITPQ